MLVRIQQFEWQSEDKETEIVFNVSLLQFAIIKNQILHEQLTIAMDEDAARYMMAHREYNVDRVRLMPDSHFHRPILGVLMPDDTTLVIDGTHRYLAHFMRHVPTIQMERVKYKDIGPFMQLKGKPL